MTVPSLSTSASASQAGSASEILSLNLRDSWLGKSEETALVGGLLCTAKPAKPAKPAPPSSNIGGADARETAHSPLCRSMQIVEQNLS